MKVPRTKIIEDYQKNMGYVDRHNRFRQSILGLATVWKTKRWQTRVLQDIFGIALVDSYLLARKFMPKWNLDASTQGSHFMKFVRTLLPQLADSNEDPDVGPVTRCVQVKIGMKTILDGKQKGQKRPIQMRCTYCIKEKRYFASGNRARRTIYTCICHPNIFTCREGAYNCWQEHLAAQKEANASGEEESSDDDDTMSSSCVTPGRNVVGRNVPTAI
jgi:hypothetical protein